MVRRARFITVRFIGHHRYRLDVGESLPPTIRPVVLSMPNEPGASGHPIVAIGSPFQVRCYELKRSRVMPSLFLRRVLTPNIGVRKSHKWKIKGIRAQKLARA